LALLRLRIQVEALLARVYEEALAAEEAYQGEAQFASELHG
jgi:hypothetical protein